MSWPMVKMSAVAQINPRCPKDIDEKQLVSFVAMASASEDGYLLNEEIKALGETKKGFTYFAKGDVLLAKITPCFENGKCLRSNQIKNEVGFGSTEFHVLRANPEVLDSNYLFYMVWNNAFRFLGEKSMSGAAGQKRVSTDFLKQFEIPLPPLAEQKRIAAILDKADAIRQKRQQAIKLADEFLRSVFLEMFGDPVTNPKGWEVKPFGDVIDILTDYHANGSYKTLNENVTLLDEPDYAYMVRTTDLEKQSYTDGVKYIDQHAYEHLSKSKVYGGEIIINKIGSAGAVYLMPFLNRPVSLAMNQFMIRCIDGQLNEFYYYQLKTSAGEKEISKRVQGAVTKTITKNAVRDIPIVCPPLKEQEKFVAIANSFSQKAILAFNNISNTESELFNSLSQKAFSGQL
ncbi:restriction endonuclease subunit S [Vibrio tritonius]|uniref:restriction endonuclease subunit S n=1 Tax=Vibrio tritonius TaxID=1435069 RepID=UPI00315DD761